jgi:hypothetical protein
MREELIHNKALLKGVTGKYTARGDLELEGSITGLTILATLLRRANDLKQVSLQVPTCPVDVKPYDGHLSTIELRPANDKIKLAREGDALIVSGAWDKMKLLADNVSLLIEDSERGVDHCHLEYYEDHPWLDATTLPIVITVVQETE